MAAAAMPARTEPAKMTSTPRSVGPVCGVIIVWVRSRSDFEADHLGHDEGADAHPHEAAEARHDEPFVDEELSDVAGVDPPDEREHDEGKGADDVSRSLGFGAHRLEIGRA